MARQSVVLEDSELLSKLRDDNRHAFNLLYDKYWEFVYNNALKRLVDHTLAEDVVQEVFTQLWLRKHLDDIKNLPAYFYIATRNQVFKLQKREGKYIPVEEIAQELLVTHENAEAKLLYKELQMAYQQLIANLPPQQQLIYELKYNKGLSTEEIASMLNLSPKTVRNQLGRTLNRIRDSLIVSIILFNIFNQ
ncbi:RNA polymerase sigma factor [Olivibacter sitiensis]|uniref:RNA polymerase sigma factor n=1 Tax=Olivibacter sitiensis TaxID=376470 RepID=UPI0004193F35|nr:sigma-70 family RNA polymerase sigma factor [Olivibacter sitiensis]